MATNNMITITKDNLLEAIKISKCTHFIIDFWAEWCGPCRQMEPVLEQLALKLPAHACLLKVNIEENTALSRQYNIRSIPTLLIMQKTQEAGGTMKLAEVKRLIGFNSMETILKEL